MMVNILEDWLKYVKINIPDNTNHIPSLLLSYMVKMNKMTNI